jgi:hypothetical protein
MPARRRRSQAFGRLRRYSDAIHRKEQRKSMQQKVGWGDSKQGSFLSMFVSPMATLDSLRERPRWLFPVLLSAIISVAANFYVIERVGLVQMIEAASQSNAIMDPQAAVQNVLAHRDRILCLQAVFTFVNSFLVALVTAKVLWLLATLFGYDIPFKKTLAVVAHANMLSVVIRECMIVLTAAIIRDVHTFDLRNPLATNIAFFLPSTSPAEFRILASLDVITFMYAALLISGLTKVCAKLSLRAASMMVFFPWAIYVGATLFVPSLL